MKNKDKELDHKDETRIQKVLSFLGHENEEVDSNCSLGESSKLEGSSEGWPRSEIEARKVCLEKKSELKKGNWVRPALGNDIYRWAHYDALKCYFNKKDGLFKPDPLFDNMDNEFLLLFEGNKDYKLGEDQLQFMNLNDQPGIARRKYPNEYTIDPLVIREELKVIRDSPEKRLKQFEEMRARGKFRRLTERERQITIRHIRTENVKKKFIHAMEWYFLTKLAEQRLRIREAEQIKYEKRVDKFHEQIAKLEKEKMRQLEETVKKKVKEEREKAELMRRALISEELLITVDSTETEIKEKYEKFLLNLKLSELSEIYQLEMNAYCKYWKRRALELQMKMNEDKEESKQELQLCEMQRILEILYEIEKFWKVEAHRSLKEIMQTVKETVALIPPKEKELKDLQEENEYLENKIGHWKKIIPEYIRQQERFIQFSFEETPEKEMLLNCLNKLKDFEEPTPEIIGRSASEVQTSTDNAILQKKENKQEAEPTEEEDFAMALADYYLSDGDFEEIAQKLLQVKFIITDLMRRVLPSEQSLVTAEENSEVENISSSSDDYCKICSPSDDNSSEKLFMLRKMEEIVKVIEDTFEVIGVNFSTPNFAKPEEFIHKRIASINQIMNMQDESKPEI